MPAGGRRRWGFHQLSDAFARQLVAAAGVGPGDLVLDIGAGAGALTAPLAATGARVVAIELHPERVALLRRRFDADSANRRERFGADSANHARRIDVESPPTGGRPSGGSTAAVGTVRVVRADAADLRLPRQPFLVVANPPWSITTALLRRLTGSGSQLRRADLVVPRHVALLWASGAAPGAGRWQRDFAAEITRDIPRRAFHPPPPQPAALLTLRRRMA